MRRIPQTGSEEDAEQLRSIAFSCIGELLVGALFFQVVLLRKGDIPKLDHLGDNGRADRRRI